MVGLLIFKFRDLNPLLLKLQSELCFHFQNVYAAQPLELVRLMKKVLNMEQAIIAQANAKNEPTETHNQSEKASEISGSLDAFLKISSDIDYLVQNLRKNYEYNSIHKSNLENYNKHKNSLTPEQTQNFQAEIKKSQEVEANISNLNLQILGKFDSIQNNLLEVHNFITIHQMRALDRSVARACNGMPVLTSLEQIEIWVQKLSDFIWKSIRQLQSLNHPKIGTELKPIPANKTNIIERGPKSVTKNNDFSVVGNLGYPITNLNPMDNRQHYSVRLQLHLQNYISLLALTVERSLVIEKQPPQILMKDKRFVATLRHLAVGVLEKSRDLSF